MANLLCNQVQQYYLEPATELLAPCRQLCQVDYLHIPVRMNECRLFCPDFYACLLRHTASPEPLNIQEGPIVHKTTLENGNLINYPTIFAAFIFTLVLVVFVIVVYRISQPHRSRVFCKICEFLGQSPRPRDQPGEMIQQPQDAAEEGLVLMTESNRESATAATNINNMQLRMTSDNYRQISHSPGTYVHQQKSHQQTSDSLENERSCLQQFSDISLFPVSLPEQRLNSVAETNCFPDYGQSVVRESVGRSHRSREQSDRTCRLVEEPAGEYKSKLCLDESEELLTRLKTRSSLSADPSSQRPLEVTT